jgi:hypothetical protein
MTIPKWTINLIVKIIGGDSMFKSIQDLLSGKKTYLVAISAVIAAAIKFSADGNVADFITAIFAALGTITMRAAIAKP